MNRCTEFGRFFSILVVTAELAACSQRQSDILIFSGRNNHDWETTTPVLQGLYSASGKFRVDVTERPDTIGYDDLCNYDVIISNWNTWPDNDFRLPESWEQEFTRYIEEGGGAVFIHAGASSFYRWDRFHEIGIGRWGKETRHGIPTTGRVCRLNRDHPVTRGLADFDVFDELWEGADIHPDAEILGYIRGKDVQDNHEILEPSIFVNRIGKGRTFFTTLGHDTLSLRNEHVGSLLLAAATWAARN